MLSKHHITSFQYGVLHRESLYHLFFCYQPTVTGLSLRLPTMTSTDRTSLRTDLSARSTISVLRTPISAQPATPTTSFSTNNDHSIEFRHPGYPDFEDQNVFLILKAFDQQDGVALHYGTAHIACAIVAGNAWDGYFTSTRDGERVSVGQNALLRECSYYFHVPSFSTSPSLPAQQPSDFPRYPLCFSFEHWSFPHRNLPPAWSEAITLGSSAVSINHNNAALAPPTASGVTSAVLVRDGGCIITGSRDCVERAHLCPRSQQGWFETNRMGRYNRNTLLSGNSVTDDVSNGVALRSDIHTLFDYCKFVIVPKESRWVAHFCDLTNTAGALYHNTPLEVASNVSPGLLLVRFAWTIFTFVKQFMECGADRYVRLRVMENGAFKEVFQTLKGGELKERGRSGSPKKRKLATVENVLEQVLSVSKRQRRHSPSPLRSPDVFAVPSLSDAQPSKPELTTSTQAPPDLSTPVSILPSALVNVCHPTIDSAPTTDPRSSPLPSAPSPPTPDPSKVMRLEYMRSRRPSDPALYCCDYRAAEAAEEAGIEGPREFGGSHLCWSCLGVEYQDEIE